MQRSPSRSPPPPQQQSADPQSRPTTIMRRGRFVAPLAAGAGDGGDGAPVQQHPQHHHYQQPFNAYDGNNSQQYYQQQQQQNNYPQQKYPQQYQQQQQVISPTSQVRFEDELRQQQQQQSWTAGNDEHSPSFLFEDGEWSESEVDNDDDNDNDTDASQGGKVSDTQPILPTEAQLTLLCLDYLRDLRRSYPNHDDLYNAEGLDADYIALAAWSLSRAFIQPSKLRHVNPKVSIVSESAKVRKGGMERMIQSYYMGGGGLEGGEWYDEPVGNDAMYRQLDDDIVDGMDSSTLDDPSATKQMFAISERIRIPSMEDITNEILLRHPKESAVGNSSEDEDDDPFYEHNDGHFSNAHRFYLLNGLASTAADGSGSGGGVAAAIQSGLMTPRGFFPRGNSTAAAAATAFDGSPLTITSIVSAGLMALRAKSRIEAEKEMVSSPLFQQFVQAASAGGFFQEKRDDRGERGGFKLSPSSKGSAPSLLSVGSNSMTNNNELTDEEKEHRSRIVYESKYRKVVNKFRQKLATKDATQLLSPNHQSVASHSPRMNSAYRIMSGNASVSSGGGGGGAEWNVLNYVMNARNVAKLQQSRRERRIERVKSERSTGGKRPVHKDAMLARSPPRSSPQDYPPSENRAIRQFEGREGGAEEVEAVNISPPASSLKTQTKGPTSASKAAAVANLPHYQEAERLNSAGNALMQQKKFQEALDTYTSAIKLAPAGPKSHVYFSNRSAAYLSLNEHERSIRDCEYSLALNPDFAKAHSRLGLAYFASGRYKEAVAAYESSLEIDPTNEWSRDHLEKARKKLSESVGDTTKSGTNKESVAATKERPVHDPIAEEAWPTPFDEAKLNAQEANDVANEDDVKQSPIEKKEESIANQISQADHHKDQGNRHMSNKEYEKALHEYNLAIQLSPSGPNSHVYYSNRAAAHCYLANYDAATADCKTSISLNASYEKAHSRLGLSLFFRGEYEDAIAAYSKSLELDPTNRASLSYLVKSKARLAEKQVVEEESRRRAEEQERNRKRQQQQQQQKQQQEEEEQTPTRDAHDGEAPKQGDVKGNSSTNDDGPRKPTELATIEEGVQSFDPFSTTDDD
ncbi:hypothetical protein ACHAWU_000842 [Discostella pseudostelligera]|uniref:Uncharacterized protein n=1 Tax=Discostella pseudostelligera TaxID=259834 RepID=A0ABD3M6H6_9STRA